MHDLGDHLTGESCSNPILFCVIFALCIPPSCLSLQDDDNLREALRYSAAMLGELRTSLLTPQRYFELYMQAFNELQNLEVSITSIAAAVKSTSKAQGSEH